MSVLEHDFWVYALRKGDMLVSHEWVELHVHRLLSSRFVAHAIRDGRRADIGTALILWAECFRQDPAGTLPDDDVELAQLAKFGADVEGWRGARAGVLYGWRPVHIDGAEEGEPPRLGHPFIERLAARAHGRKAGREQAREAGRLATLRSRVKAKLTAMKMARLASSKEVVDAVAGWLDRSQLYCTDDNVRAGLDTLGIAPKVVRLAARGGEFQGDGEV